MNSKLGRQQTKVPLAAALSPFISLLYPPNPWCEWCGVCRLTTTPGSTSPTLFEQWCGFFYLPQEPGKCKCCETGPTVFASLSEKTRKSNRLQMALQRWHFLLSYLKTLSVGPARFEPMISRSADRRSPNWANQAVVFVWLVPVRLLLLSIIAVLYHVNGYLQRAYLRWLFSIIMYHQSGP